MRRSVRADLARLRGTAGLLLIVVIMVTGCAGATTGQGTGTHSSGRTQAAAPSTGQAQTTGNLCADAATANSNTRALTEALVLHRGGQQQVSKLLGMAVATYTALGSEAPGQLRGALTLLAGYYRGIQAKVAGGGTLTLSDLEPAAHPGVAAAARQVGRYFAAHCAT